MATTFTKEFSVREALALFIVLEEGITKLRDTDPTWKVVADELTPSYLMLKEIFYQELAIEDIEAPLLFYKKLCHNAGQNE